MIYDLPYFITMGVVLASGILSGYCFRNASAARELARLRGLVPEAELLRRAAGVLHYVTAGRGVDKSIASMLFRQLEELAARIDEEGDR